MSFLESVQHGLQKASQEAVRLTTIRHLHHVATDLNFKASQEGQNLIAKAMELYHGGYLGQGELVAICHRIATYQQQINEVQEEIQKLHSPQEEGDQQAAPAPIPPTGYPAYPPAPYPQAYAPGAVPPAYPPYPAPQADYPTYAAPTAPAGYPSYPAQPAQPQASYPPYPAAYPPPGYAAYSASPSGEPPTRPGAPVQNSDVQPLAVSNEPPTRPGTPRGTTSQDAVTNPALPPQSAPASAEIPAGIESSSTSTPGTYAQGVLPPIFSPFATNPAATENAAEAEPEKPSKAHRSAKKAATEEAEPKKPSKAHHSTKKTATETEDSAEAPAKEK